MKQKTEVFLVELTLDDDLDGESILEHCEPADKVTIRKLTYYSLKDYDWWQEYNAEMAAG